MIVHVSLLAYICILALFIYRRIDQINYQSNVKFVLLAFVGIFFIQGFRGPSVGDDTSTYFEHFQSADYGTVVSWEPFSVALMMVVRLFTSNPTWLMLAIALIIDIGIAYFIIRNTPDDESAFWPVFRFITMTMYFSSMNLLRQYLAVSIAINVYSVLNRSRSIGAWIRSAILIVIATLFHTTGLLGVMLMIPFIPRRITRKSFSVLALIAVAAGIAVPVLLQLFVMVFTRYARYLSSKFMNDNVSSGYYFMLSLIYFVIIILSFICLNPRKESNEAEYRLMVIALMSFSLILMQRVTSLAIRLSYIFEIFIILLIPMFISKLTNERKMQTCFKIAVFVIFWAYFIYNQSIGSARGCVPYYFVWQQVY